VDDGTRRLDAVSTVWGVRCPLDDAIGPLLHRNAGGAGIDSDEWRAFLGEHEYHGPLILEHEPTSVRMPLASLLHSLLVNALDDPEPPLPPVKQGGVIAVASLWAATGLPEEAGRAYADLDAMIEDLMAWVKLGAAGMDHLAKLEAALALGRLGKVEAVLALHHPSTVMSAGEHKGFRVCFECVGINDDNEPTTVPWPCATAQACGVFE
jgi:hypothetical protein